MPESIAERNRLSKILGEGEISAIEEKNFFVEFFTSFKQLCTNPMVLGLVICFMLHTISTLGLNSTSSVYYQVYWGWTSQTMALAYAAFGVCMSFVQGFMVKPCVHKFGPRLTIVVGFLLGGISSVPYGFIKDGWYSFIVIPVKACGVIAIPVLQGMVSKQYHPDIQGKILGALGGCQVISNFIGPILFSFTYDYFNSHHAVIFLPQIIFFAAAGLEILGVIILAIVFYVYRNSGAYMPLINVINSEEEGEEEEEPVNYHV